MLLLFFLSVLEDNYSLQVTLVDYQYQKDYKKSQQCTRPGINKQICRWGNNYKPLGRWLNNKNRSRKSKGNFVPSLVYVQGYLSIGKRETWVIAK